MIKNIAAISIATMALSFSAMAANFTTTVQCLPQPGNIAVGGAAITVTCASLLSLVSGVTLVSATMDTIGDYTGGPNGTTTGTEVDVTVSGISGFAATSLLSAATGGRFRSAQTNPSTNNTTLTASQGQTLSVSAAAVSGSATGASNYTEITYTYSTGTTPSPEPTSMALLGSGLIGLAFAGRKRFARK